MKVKHRGTYTENDSKYYNYYLSCAIIGINILYILFRVYKITEEIIRF